MADASDRGRRRKKRLPSLTTVKPRERSCELDTVQTGKTLVILSKPQPEKSVTQTDVSPHSPTRQNELKPPTVLLKAREGSDRDGSRSASPGGISSSASTQSAASLPGRESDVFADLVKAVAQRVYHIQQKPSSTNQGSVENDQKLTPIQEMNSPVKLVDDSLQWCDSAMEYLQDQTDFYVVGVLGLQGTGKSTILSMIGGEYNKDGGGWQMFKPQTREMKEHGEHCTCGIDICITSERVILLDTQPVLSASVMDHMIQYEKKALGGPEYHSTENALLMQSLQLAAFLMAVCHTIVVAQDWFTDINLLRFIQSAEMLKPTTPTNPHEIVPTPEDTTEYYPHIVFVQNKCSNADFSHSAIADMKKALSVIFQKSKLKFTDSVKIGYIHEDESIYKNVNLFLLPENSHFDSESLTSNFPEYQGHPEFNYLTKNLMYQILSMPRNLLTHTALSEKNWFHYAARIWETVKKSSLFLEYNRLLP